MLGWLQTSIFTPSRVRPGFSQKMLDLTKIWLRRQLLTRASPSKRGTDVIHPLPEDEPIPMTTVCQVIHLKFNVLGEHLSADDLVDIGLVADKYDCAEALTAAAFYWVGRIIDSVDHIDRATLLVATYLLKLEQPFQQLSYDLAMTTTSDKKISLDCALNLSQMPFASLLK